MTMGPGSSTSIRIVTLADDLSVAPAMWAVGESIWPPFMLEDPVADRYYGRVESDFADCCLVALDGEEVVARGFFVPFAWDGGALPERGWDAVVERGVADRDAGRTPTAASALEIGIVPGRRGRGLSGVMLEAMRAAVAAMGLADLVAPVRPSGKHVVPHEPMREYLRRHTDDGLPADPWLRVHVRAGASIVGVAPRSMHIQAPVADWEAWGGEWSGDRTLVVPLALAPVVVDRDTGVGTYVEPNVWVHHRLA